MTTVLGIEMPSHSVIGGFSSEPVTLAIIFPIDGRNVLTFRFRTSKSRATVRATVFAGRLLPAQMLAQEGCGAHERILRGDVVGQRAEFTRPEIEAATDARVDNHARVTLLAAQ